jgi:hypothetical protein
VLRSPGQPLDANARAFFEPRFGHDFSKVRIHADEEAAESAQGVNALAYTVGCHVVFAESRYAPATAPGQRLLAHELAHSIQQGEADSRWRLGSASPAGPVPAVMTRWEIGRPGDVYEQEADRAAEHVMCKMGLPGPDARETDHSRGRPAIEKALPHPNPQLTGVGALMRKTDEASPSATRCQKTRKVVKTLSVPCTWPAARSGIEILDFGCEDKLRDLSNDGSCDLIFFEENFEGGGARTFRLKPGERLTSIERGTDDIAKIEVVCPQDCKGKTGRLSYSILESVWPH